MDTPNQTKMCGQCRRIKSITDYKRNYHGNYQKTCISCLTKKRKTSKKYHKLNREKHLLAVKLTDLRNPIGRIIRNCKNSDKKANRFFNLDKIYVQYVLEMTEYCCYHCNNLLEMTNGSGYNPNQFSIDRVNNILGHIKGNCVASCWGCNLKRGSKLIDEFTPYPINPFILDDFEEFQC